MNKLRIGIGLLDKQAPELLQGIQRLERIGVPAVWLITGGGRGYDALTVFANAAANTDRIMMGTAVSLTLMLHPVTLAQQARVVNQLAPGRIRIGVGPGDPGAIKAVFGAGFKNHRSQLSEYIRVVRDLLQKGSVDFDGQYFPTHTSIGQPMDVPVMGAAHGPKSFELSGAEADGAISWLSPGIYLRDVALPAMRRGAERNGIPTPPLIAHVPICISNDLSKVHRYLQSNFGYITASPGFKVVYSSIGFPEIHDGICTKEMTDSLVAWGNEEQVTDRLKQIISFGVTELIVTPLLNNESPTSFERYSEFVAGIQL
jgi:alkanesulfonate monooxygenase SsuD/methylene tetrahydromethanopterin reductase-like flavin-dependent oxidoreductase (luciferase family)